MYPLAGIPMLVFLLRRLQAGLSNTTYRIILGTSDQHQNDIIVAWGTKEEVAVFRGDENDVLNRYAKCLECYPADTVVRVTADNPLTCPEIIKKLVLEKKSKDADYIQCTNLPYGAGVDVFSSGVLKYLDQNVSEPDEREHINLHILRNRDKFKTFSTDIHGELARPDLNMTIDTKEDWHRIESLFDPAEKESWKIPLREAIERMDKKPV